MQNVKNTAKNHFNFKLKKGANVMFREEKYTTKNGVDIFSYKNPNIHGFYISLFLRAGSMHEEISGITHFLEHAAIRNVGSLMNGGLYSTLDRYGMDFNASTFSEMVQFYITGASANFDRASEIICRLLSPIALSSDEIRAERDRIKAEIRESDDRTSLPTFAYNIVYEGTTLARTITGTLGEVQKITKTKLENYRRSIMTAENMFFYVTGSFTDDNIERLASLIEGYSLESGVMQQNIAPVCSKFGKRDTHVYVKNADFTMLRFTFDMDMTKVSVAESDLLYDLLLGGYNSRLFIEMSEKRGMFYDISGSSDKYSNIGSLVFFFEVKGDTLVSAVETVVEILRDFKKNSISPEDMMWADYVDNAGLLYDDARELNFVFAYDNHVMNAGYSSVEERAEMYRSVTPDRLREVAEMIFRPENLTLAIKGNKKKIDIEKLEEIVNKL